MVAVVLLLFTSRDADAYGVCTQPVPRVAIVLLNQAVSAPNTRAAVAQTINYLTRQYCIEYGTLPSIDYTESIGNKCTMYSGNLAGERVYWADCPTDTQPFKLPSQPNVAQLRRQTETFLERWYALFSGPNPKVMEAASTTYAENVDYFGKVLPRPQVLTQLNSFIDRWPVRRYVLRRQSLDIQCDEAALICSAKGTIDYDSRNPAKNEQSSGIASFEFRLDYSSTTATPQILREDGMIVERKVPQ